MLIRNYSPVTEAYFGKTKNLMEVEHIIQDIIDKFTVPFKDIGKRRIDAVKVNKSSQNKKIEALLCKEFGFKEFVLHWDGNDEVNAYTVTHGILKLTDGSEPVLPIRNSDGTYYDSKHAYICVVNIYAGLVDVKLTAEEVVACLLHEIGHNFVCTPVVNMVSLTEWAFLPINVYMAASDVVKAKESIWDILMLKYMDKRAKHDPEYVKAKGGGALVTLILSIIRAKQYYEFIKTGIYRVFFNYIAPEYTKEWFAKFDEWIVANKNKILAEWDIYVKEVEKAKEFFKKNPDYINWTGTFLTTLDFVSLFFMGKLLIIEQLLVNQSGYSNEVFADSFATAYGYGSATVSMQRKFSYYTFKNKTLAKPNKYNVYNQYILLMTRLMYTFLDEHPMNQTRMAKQIAKMKDELNNPEIDPRIRKELLKDLERSEKIYNDYCTKLPPEFKHLAVILNFIQLNEKYFGGQLDLREPINRVLNFGKAEA